MSAKKTKSTETTETQEVEVQATETTETAVATETQIAEVQAIESQSNVMYLGPTIVGVVRHSTVFKGGVLPKKVEECVNQLPIMKKLFVALDEVPKAVIELKKEQSVLATVYSQTANKFK